MVGSAEPKPMGTWGNHLGLGAQIRLDRLGLDWLVLDWTGLAWIGLDRILLDWLGWNLLGLDWLG